MSAKKVKSMNEHRYIFLGIIVFLLLTFHLTTIGFSQTAELKDTPPIEPRSLEMVQIPDYAKSSMSLIKDIRDIVDKQEKINEILPGLEDVLSVLDKKDSILSDTLKIYRLDGLT
jgi:hypothetical protein